MTRQLRTTRPPFGVTLIEMMVSLAITTFVILVVNQLFSGVVATVARGTQGGEMLLKSRMFDERLAFETELQVNDHTEPGQWLSRMVGPGGRLGENADGVPGGFLVIVQHNVDAPLTIDDALQIPQRLSSVRSDQLMFVYDQDSPLDAGTKRMPALAPSSNRSFTGDARDSQNAEYVRMWYGHVLQLPPDEDAKSFNVTNPPAYKNIDLGTANSTNPNALAQDWVLGRHALLMTDSQKPVTASDPWPVPYGLYINDFPVIGNNLVNGPAGSPKMGNGLCDVANFTLNDLVKGRDLASPLPPISSLASSPSLINYQGKLLDMMFSSSPMLTAAKPLGSAQMMEAWDVSPTHTYFMGGVSDFIVEWAGDMLNTNAIYTVNLPTQIGPDGQLDRDPLGHIKWYTSPIYANPVDPTNGFKPRDLNAPITYPVPAYTFYTPHMNNPGIINLFRRASDAFAWRHFDPDPAKGFTQWPWMIRIRYRLHDRRGQFEGREVTNPTTGNTELEKGLWYETIIQVNYQNIEP